MPTDFQYTVIFQNNSATAGIAGLFQQDPSPSDSWSLAWLTKYAQGALDRLNREMPPATAEILERESQDFLADVELFLEAECEPRWNRASPKPQARWSEGRAMIQRAKSSR